jgi:hypothetical protein
MTQTSKLPVRHKTNSLLRKDSKHLHETQDTLGNGDSKRNSNMRPVNSADFNAGCGCVTSDIL